MFTAVVQLVEPWKVTATTGGSSEEHVTRGQDLFGNHLTFLLFFVGFFFSWRFTASSARWTALGCNRHVIKMSDMCWGGTGRGGGRGSPRAAHDLPQRENMLNPKQKSDLYAIFLMLLYVDVVAFYEVRWILCVELQSIPNHLLWLPPRPARECWAHVT